MGGVGDFLFGKSDSGGLEGYANTMTSAQKALLKEVLGQVRGGVQSGISPYPGTQTPQASDLQTRAFEHLMGVMGGPQLDSTQAAIDKLMSGPQDYAGNFNPQQTREYWQDAFVDPATRRWERDVVPGIQEKYIANDALDSGAARRAVVSSAGDLQTGLNAQLAQLLQGEKMMADEKTYGASENFLNRLFQVPGMESTNLSNNLNLGMTGLSAGGVQRGIEGEQLGEEFSNWLMQQGYNNPWLQLAFPTMGMQTRQPIVSGPSQQSGLFQDMLTPLLTGYLSTETGARNAPNLINPISWF